MSESEHRQHESELCDGGNGEEDDEEDKEREDVGGGGELDGEVRRKGVSRTSRDFRKAVKHPFRKKKKQKERGEGEVVKLPSARRRGRRIRFSGGRSGGSCYVCFLQPKREESPETPTSDPNSETFSFEMLRTLIEKNDFYCKECNTNI